MIAHFVICTLGSPDLLELAIASVHKYAGETTLDLLRLPESAYGNPAAHGNALDTWRNEMVEQRAFPDEDAVVIMDPDTVILTSDWRTEMETTFRHMSKVGIWGAGCREDFGLRIHPSMMAIRGTVFNNLTATFRPFARPGDREWLDTGGWYCKCARDHGWKLWREERALGYDWHGASAWYAHSTQYLRHQYAHHTYITPMWVHLGGGTHSDPARLNWVQKLRRRRAIATRRRFVAAVKEHLAR